MKIAEAKITLAELQKQSKLTSMASQMTAANQAQKKKKDDEEQEVNINMLMEDLKKDIHFAYNNRDYTLGS